MSMFGKTGRPAAANGGGDMSFIGSDVTIAGNIVSKGGLHIDGRIDGDVGCASVTLGAGGIIHGNVTADDARIAGTIEGTIAAKSLVIDATARINGDLSYDSVSIDAGAMVEGRVKRLTRDSTAPLKLIAGDGV